MTLPKKTRQSNSASDLEYPLQRSILDHLDDAVVAIDEEGVVIFWNRAAAERYGVADALGMRLGDVYSYLWPRPEDEKDFADSIKGAGHWRGELGHVTRDGRELYVESSVSVLEDGEGRRFGLLAVIRDATDRTAKAVEREKTLKMMEVKSQVARDLAESFRQEHALLSLILEKTGAHVVYLASDGTIRRLYEEFAALTGKKTADLVGESFYGAFPRIVFKSYVDQVVESGDQLVLESMPVSFRPGQAPSGFYDCILSPVKDSDGVIDGVVASFIDVTDKERSKRKLEESEEQFRRAIEEAPIPVVIHAEDGEVLQLSRTWTELTGYGSTDIGSFDEWATHAVYGEGAEAVGDYVQTLFSSSSSSRTRIDFGVRTKTGELRHWSFSASAPGTLADGRRFVVGMALDITDRKIAEEELARNHEVLQSIYDAIPVLLVIWDAKQQKFILNRQTEKTLGWTTDDANDGNFMVNVYPDPDYRREVATFMASHDPGWREWLARTKDGDAAPIEWTNVQLTDDSSIGIGLDLRERKKAEENLKKSEERYRLAQRAGEIGSWDWDIAGQTITWSDYIEPLFGLAPGEFGGSYDDFIALVHEDDRERVDAAIRAVLEDDDDYDVEHRITCPDGSVRWLREIGDVIRDEAGKAVRMVGIVSDISDEKKLALQRRHLIRDLSHQLKTPLSIIEMAADTLPLTAGTKQEKASENVEMIARNARRLRGLVDRILRVSELESGRLPVKPVDVDVPALVHDVLDELRPLAAKKGISLTTGALPDLCVTTDPTLLKEALINLTDNAVRYTREGGVTVSAKAADDRVEVCVSDTGRGLSRDGQKDIFERFYKGDASEQGTGLGLTIVGEVATLLKGDVKVSSPGRGQGSTFTFSFSRNLEERP